MNNGGGPNFYAELLHALGGRTLSKFDSTPDVRHPELYSAENKFSAEIEVAELLHALVRLIKPDYVLEVGVGTGGTAWSISQALERNGIGFYYGFEVDYDRWEIAKRRVGEKWGVVINDVYENHDKYVPEDAQFHLAFLDASLESKNREFLAFVDRFPKGAIIAFHDTGYGRERDMSKPKRAEVAVQKLEKTGLIRRVHFQTPRGFSIGEVL